MAEDDPFAAQIAEMQGRQGGAATADVDPFAEQIARMQRGEPPPPPEQTSGLEAAGVHAAAGVIPAAGVLVGAEYGAATGTAIGSLAGPIGAGIGGAVGALAGGFGGGYLGSKAQDMGMEALPGGTRDAIKQELEVTEKEHPYWSMAGTLSPYAVTMTPFGEAGAAAKAATTSFGRVMAHPYWGRALGGALQGVLELGQEYWSGETPDWAKVGIATTFGFVWNKPNRIGEMIGKGARAPFGIFGREVTPEAPTIANVDAANVAGPGVTEDVADGSLKRNEAAQQAAQDAQRVEQSITGPKPEPDLHGAVERMAPEAVARRDELAAAKGSLEKFRQVHQDMLDRANAQLVVPGLDIEDRTNLEAQKASAEDAVARYGDHIARIDDELLGIQDQIGAAYRRAAESHGAPTVAPAVASAIDEQKAFIASDVKQKLMAAGRPKDEAEAAGKLDAEHFAAYSAMGRGAWGSPEEMYRREGSTYAGPGGPAPMPVAPVVSPAEAVGAAEPMPAGALIGAVNPDEALKKADRLELTNLIRALDGQGATPREIADVVGRKMSVNEITAAIDALHAAPREVEIAQTAAPPAREELEQAAAQNEQAKAYEAAFRRREQELGRALTRQDVKDLVAEAEKILASERETELEQEKLGKFRLRANDVRGEITFWENADASTIIHEKGHEYLERMGRYANREDAPAQLKQDWDTIKRWTGHDFDKAPATPAEKRSWRRAHEKVADGFIQYMREGRAPSRELAGVFARFKDWLLGIYRTVKGLGEPVNDDIRRVFDRWLSAEPHETVIAPDRPVRPTLDDIHAADAIETAPGPASAAAAERVEAEALRREQETPGLVNAAEKVQEERTRFADQLERAYQEAANCMEEIGLG